ncbi:hypothetical protein Tco_0941770 [Tanacetum coccineum]|uniref:Uncharacterized protein n=1 Tax=Tanacetum coccineum TaxID=301880 RepID=A0ABQ5DSA7_9ASTR
MLHASGSSDGFGSQLKAPDKSEDKTTSTNEGTGTKPGVPDVSTYDSENENKSWGDSEDDDNDSDDVHKYGNDDDGDSDGDDNDASDTAVRTPDSYASTDDDERNVENREFDEEVYDELYKDVDVKSLRAGHEKGRKGDVEMTDADQNTESSKQSSSVSSDFASKFLNFDNVPPVDTEVASLLKIKGHSEEPSSQTSSHFTIPISSSAPTTTTLPSVTPLLQQSTTTPAPTTESTTSLISALPDFASLFGFDQRVYALEMELSQLDKDLFATYGKAYSLKRNRDNKDKDEDPPARPDQGLNKRKSSKDDEPPREPVFETADIEMLQDQGGDLGNIEDQPNVEEASKHDWFKKPEMPLTFDPEWNVGKQIDFRPPQT